MTKYTENSTLARRAQLGSLFEELEDRIVQKLRTEASSEEGRAELLRSTGLHDEVLLNELSSLGIPADGLMALRLFPLILVAWAEDDADAKERTEVLSQALKIGIRQDTTAWILLTQRLAKKPPGLGVDAWKRYVHEIFSSMSDVAKSRLIQLTESQMQHVAKASGGHFGFGKVSKKEAAIIRQITTAMRQQTLMR